MKAYNFKEHTPLIGDDIVCFDKYSISRSLIQKNVSGYDIEIIFSKDFYGAGFTHWIVLPDLE